MVTVFLWNFYREYPPQLPSPLARKIFSESNGYNFCRPSFCNWSHPYITPPGLYPFEALAEIFDFVAGLVQRVPKKTNEVKFDLLNSTASQGDCNWENFVVFGCGSSLLPLYPHQSSWAETVRRSRRISTMINLMKTVTLSGNDEAKGWVIGVEWV